MSPVLLLGALFLIVATVVERRRKGEKLLQYLPLLGAWVGIGVAAFLDWTRVDQDLFWVVVPFLFGGSAIGLLASPMVRRSVLEKELAGRASAEGSLRIDVQELVDQLRPSSNELVVQAAHALPGPYLIYWGLVMDQLVAVGFGVVAAITGAVGLGLLVKWKALAASHERRLLA